MLKVGSTPEVKQDEKVKVEAEAKANVNVTPEDASEYGVKSDTLVFEGPLGDPSQDDEYQGNKIAKIVGYAFSSKEDIVIPDCGTNAGFKQDAMNYENIEGTKKVKAGEKFALTPFETALLISRKEYNGQATGGKVQVSARYQFKGNKTKSGEVVKVAATPRVSLVGVGTSIKEIKMTNVLTFKAVKNENGQTRKERTIVKGFEKWAPLAAAAVRKPRESAGTSKAAVNKNAQAFMAFVAGKATK